MRQRAARANELRDVANEAIGELNRMYQPGQCTEGGQPRQPGRHASDQQHADVWHTQLALAKRARREPGDPTGGLALRQLLKSEQPGYRDDKSKPHFLCAQDVPLVDEPSDTHSVSMEEWCSAEFLARFNETAIRESVRSDVGGLAQHGCRVYGSKRAYAQYLVRARGLELVGFASPANVKVCNSVFFIHKKSGRLRKIIDCRPSNAFYNEPDQTRLPGPWHACDISGESFFSAEADVESAFTRVRTLPWMWQYQGLPGVVASSVMTAEELRRGELRCRFTGECFKAGDVVVPVYLRLPMGGCRSGEVMLDIIENVLGKALETEGDLKCFNRPIGERLTLDVTGRSCAWGVYLDNYFIIGADQARVNHLLQKGVAALEAVGLHCGTIGAAERKRTIIGLEFDGEAGTIGVARPRVRLLRESGMALAACDEVDLAVLRRVIGHFSWAFLTCRPLFAVFGSVYHMLHSAPGGKVAWIPEARAELLTASRLVHLAFTSTRTPTAPLLLVTDAEGMNATDLGGGAVVARALSAELASEFRHTDKWEVRPGAQPPEWFRHQVSPERTDWATVEARRWRHSGHNNEGELEAVLLAAKNVARAPSLRGHVIPLLTDSAVALGALRKGRSSKRRIRSRLKKVTAISLAYRVWLAVRWVPTALCAADAPSRTRAPCRRC